MDDLTADQIALVNSIVGEFRRLNKASGAARPPAVPVQLVEDTGKSSFGIGVVGESTVYSILSKKWKTEIVRGQSHSGDLLITTMVGGRPATILVEVKNYATPVPKQEIDKFYTDVYRTRPTAALFISIKSKIRGVKGMVRYRKTPIPVGFVSLTTNEEVLEDVVDTLMDMIVEFEDTDRVKAVLSRVFQYKDDLMTTVNKLTTNMNQYFMKMAVVEGELSTLQCAAAKPGDTGKWIDAIDSVKANWDVVKKEGAVIRYNKMLDVAVKTERGVNWLVLPKSMITLDKMISINIKDCYIDQDYVTVRMTDNTAWIYAL